MSNEALDLKEFLERARASLVERQHLLEQEVAQAQQRLDDQRAQIERVNAALAAIQDQPSLNRPDAPRTIKEAVLQLLRPIAPNGMSAIDILKSLAAKFEMHYERTSLSPQLSRLKYEGKVGLKGGLWYFIETEPAQERSS